MSEFEKENVSENAETVNEPVVPTENNSTGLASAVMHEKNINNVTKKQAVFSLFLFAF